MGRGNPSELLIRVGRVETMAADAPTADAVLVRGGRVAAVGSADELGRLAGAGVEVADFPGATLLPGINDSHLHVAAWGATRPPLAIDVSPASAGSIADVARVVAAAVREAAPGEWIRGNGWHPAALAECRAGERESPSRHDLDAISPDNPVVLSDFSQHALWLNSRAMEIAGIDASTPVPDGGAIPRDEHGEPIGILSELAAQQLVLRHMPTLTRGERKLAITEATAELHRLGITSATDPAIGPAGGDGIFGMETLHAYEELARDGELKLRVGLLMLFGAEGAGTAADVAEGLASTTVQTTDERWLRDAGMKIFADGIPPLRTSWLSTPYAGDTHSGRLVIPGADDEASVAELTEMIRLAHVAGRQVGVHATGDRAVDAVVDAFVLAQERHPRADARHYVIHGDLVSHATLVTLATHRFGLNVQPQIKLGAAELMSSLLGEQRGGYQWPNRDALDLGVPLAFSSDAPVCHPDWREGVMSAVLRESPAGGPVHGPEQRIALREALAAYTSEGARQDFAEDFKGRVAPGQLADFCVLEQDPFAVDPHELAEIAIAATFVDGEAVHVK